ncbi:MAG: UbiA-like protein EboC [Bacteroidota bacterium]
MNETLKGYLRLMRPANLPTAAADIIAGTAISGIYSNTSGFSIEDQNALSGIIFLILSSIGLYAAGVVLNDVFDVKVDMLERPERPIPSGLISVKSASIFGVVLLILGILSAFLVHMLCGMIALLLALSIVAYDSFSKRNPVAGPLNMGICRGLNLLLGISLLGALPHWWYVFVPVVYIAAITLISRGEVHGNNKRHIIFAAILYAMVILSVIVLALLSHLGMFTILLFLLLFALLIYRPLWRAYVLNSPDNIKKAVIAGVLSLIVLDAAIAVGFSNLWLGLIVLLLLPLSLMLSKLFAVT